VVDLKNNLCRGKDSMALKITKAQYAHLIREISDALKDNITGGRMYDFSALEVYSEHPINVSGQVLGRGWLDARWWFLLVYREGVQVGL
jgi:hypothetical protein